MIYGGYGHCVGDYLMGSAQDPALLYSPPCQSGVVAGRHPAICRLVAIVIVAIIIFLIIIKIKADFFNKKSLIFTQKITLQ